MRVLRSEVTSREKNKGFCYNSAKDTLQFSKEIFNELNTLERNTYNPQYRFFQEEMEKIDAGDLSNLAAVKFDEYLGLVGLPDEIAPADTKRRLDGIC